jgi:DNA-binding transcriptional MerR regulator
MLSVEVGTLRAWEDRYGVVVPARSRGSQRLFSRDQVEQLRFVLRCIEAGSSPADAHRLLQSRSGPVQGPQQGPRETLPLVLLAERDRCAAELVEYLLCAEGYDVALATSAASARDLFASSRPALSVLEVALAGGLELCHRLALGGTSPVLAMSSLELADEALSAGASAFLRKPLERLQFVSAVQDLLGSRALIGRERPAAG